MSHVTLNPALFEPAQTPRAVSTIATSDASLIRSGSRRRFLQGVAAATAVVSCDPLESFDGPLRATISGRTASVWAGGRRLWEADATWLAGRAGYTVRTKNDSLWLTLAEARYPGTDLAAGFTLRLWRECASIMAVAEHALGVTSAPVHFERWLMGLAAMEFVVGARISAAVGNSLALVQRRRAHVSWLPSLGLRAHAKNGWSLRGSEFSGRLGEVMLEPVTEAPLVSDTGTLFRTRWSLRADDDAVLFMRPQLSRGKDRIGIGRTEIHSLRLETVESGGGQSYGALLAEGNRAVVISRPGIDGAAVRSLAQAPRYARAVATGAVDHAVLVARAGATLVPFGPHVLSANPAASSTVRVEAQGDTCTVDCQAYPASLSIASTDSTSVAIRFPHAPERAVCPFSFRGRELPVDGAEVVFRHPDSAMHLRFRFVDCVLRRRWSRVHIVAGPRARLILVAGPQAVREQAWFDAPDNPQDAGRLDEQRAWLDELYTRSGAPESGRDKFIEEGLAEYVFRTAQDRDEVITLPGRARIAGDSKLVFRLRQQAIPGPNKKVTTIDLTVQALLDPTRWQLVVVRDAFSTEEARLTTPADTPDPPKNSPPPDATSLEITSGLQLSPDEFGYFEQMGGSALEGSRYRDLFRLAGRSTRPVMSLRAVAAEGFDADATRLPVHADVPFRSALDARDRVEFVWLSSEWERPALLGTRDVRVRSTEEPGGDGYGVYVPRALDTQLLMLTSMGAYCRTLGLWDPPGLSHFALSVERWEHASSLARSNHDVVVYKGYLLPIGVRASVLKVTRREERKVTDLGPVSTPIQRFFIEVTHPVVEYGEHLAPHAGRSWPFRQLELLLDGPVQIDLPEDTDINGLKQSAFRVCVGGEGLWFPFAIDGEQSRQGRACLLFVDNTIAHDLGDLDAVVAEFPSRGPMEWGPVPQQPHRPGSTNYWMDLMGSKVQYAPSLAREDTWFVTHRMYATLGVHRDLINTPIIEASGKPPTYPEMATSCIVIPALNRLTGKSASTQTEVEYARAFLDVGFGRSGADEPLNESEVFLSLRRLVDMSFAGAGNRSGAVATPNVEIHHLSRHVGPMGQTSTPLAARPDAQALRASDGVTSKVAFNAADLFKPDAKLLGVLPMSLVFEAIGLDEVPKFIESVEHRLDAALGDLQDTFCAFVRNAQPAIEQMLTRLDEETANSTPAALAPALQALNRANDSLRELATVCASTDPAAAQIVARIATIGADLEAAVTCLRSVQQNPAVLLPAGITEVIAQWKALYEAFRLAAQTWREKLASAESLLRGQLRSAEEQLRREVGTLVARELDRATSRVLDEVVRWVGQAIDPVAVFETITALVARYHDVFVGVIGWYDELEVHTAECRAAVEAIIAAAKASWEGGAIHQRLTDLRAHALSLDVTVRGWPDAAEESCRAWYRRVEPTLDDLHGAWKTLLANPDPRALPKAVEAMSASLVALTRSVSEELAELQRQLGTPPPAESYAALRRNPIEYKTYLDAVEARLRAVDAAFGAAIVAFRDLRVLGQTLNVTLRAVSARLHAAGARAIPGVLGELVGFWTGGVGSDAARQAFSRLLALGGVAYLSRIAGTAATYPQQLATLRAALLEIASDTGKLLAALLRAVVDDVTDPDWVTVLRRYSHLLPLDFVRIVDQTLHQARSVREQIEAGKATLPGTEDFVAFRDALREAADRWRALARQVASIGDAPQRFVLEAARQQVEALLQQLVPAEVKLDFELTSQLTKSVAGVFKPGVGDFKATSPGNEHHATLELGAHLTQNLVSGASTAEFRGRLADFRLDLFGFIVIKFDEVSFEARNGASPRLHPPSGIDAKLEGCLAFVNQLRAYFQKTNGPYVLPSPTGITAGYRFDPGTIQIGTMVISDLVLDAGIRIPFDDRAAVTALTVASRDNPCKLCVTPYGGAMFFGIEMVGDRLHSIEASFEAGLVSVFDLVSVKGSGRVTFGIYFHQSGKAITLDGFFFAGGSATILSIITMSVSLRIGFRSNGETVTGYGEFSVEIGCSPFEWTLEYSVRRNISGGSSGNARLRGLAVVDEEHEDRGHRPSRVFLERSTWRAFQDAFAE